MLTKIIISCICPRAKAQTVIITAPAAPGEKAGVRGADGFDIIEVIRYLAQSEKPIDDRHVIADLGGPRFQAFTQPCAQELIGSPMHNPFGRLKLVSLRDIAESN